MDQSKVKFEELSAVLAELSRITRIVAVLPSGAKDPGMLVKGKVSAKDVLNAFIKAIAKHRHHEREMDPPTV